MRNWKLEVCFWTFLKPLIKCDRKVFFLHCHKVAYMATFYTSYLVSWVIEDKELFLTIKLLSGEISLQALSRFHFRIIVIFDLYKWFIWWSIFQSEILGQWYVSIFCDAYLTSRNKLNYDLKKISDWAFQWKMNFNPDPKKHHF